MAVRHNARGSSRRTQSNRFVGALFVGVSLIAAAFIVRGKSGDEVEAPRQIAVAAQYDTLLLPVPEQPVAAGTKIREMKFKTASFAKQQLPEGALTKVDEYLDAVAVTALPANLPIFRENLTFTGSGTNPVMERIPPGMRAMTIKVDATASVEGWAGSGSIVDVLLIEKDKTSVIAEKVKILSAERSVAPIEGSASPNVPSTVTLLVTQEQCLAVNTAIPLGRIAFALRGISDDATWREKSFNSDQLKGGPVQGDARVEITGYASVKDRAENDPHAAYALTGRTWVKTEVVPQGFFPAGRESPQGGAPQKQDADRKIPIVDKE